VFSLFSRKTEPAASVPTAVSQPQEKHSKSLGGS
jgi:hypothetical protein